MIKFWDKASRVTSFSIKKLSLLGFSLVAFPLVLALLYSANQVNELSKQGTNAIFTVAELINTNQKISNTLKKMERYASQYIVLQEFELMEKYIDEQKLLLKTNKVLIQHEDSEITKLATLFDKTLQQVHLRIISQNSEVTNIDSPETLLSLEALQAQFKRLITVNEQVNARSRNFINHKAQEIKGATTQVSHTLLQSLFIIPVSLIIAALFIMLINNPLKQLIIKIQRFQRGTFEQEASRDDEVISGFIEIKEINDALNNMRNRLHALELQKSSFIRHISHELKTPLAAIREGTELIYDNSVGSLNSDQQEVINIIRTSTTRLQKLIEELLDFNIVLDSTSLQDKESINLSELIEQVLTDRTLDIKRKNIIIEKGYSNTVIESNAKQLIVIIDNLLSNAIKYSPDSGVVKIAVECHQSHLLFSISDQGEGIKLEHQEKVFDAFYQGPSPKDYNIKSSGLGLTIVKELLMRLNGDITFVSRTQPPSGTTMKITLNKRVNGESQ